MLDPRIKTMKLFEIDRSPLVDMGGKPGLDFKVYEGVNLLDIIPFVPGNNFMFTMMHNGTKKHFQVSFAQYDPINNPSVVYVIAYKKLPHEINQVQISQNQAVKI